jgi:hypothetical protein
VLGATWIQLRDEAEAERSRRDRWR